eukprot:1499795-Ditylum_brightwellii.AAC.1
MQEVSNKAKERHNISSDSITISLNRRCKMSPRTCSVKLCHNAQGFNVYVKRQEECCDFFTDTQQPITNQQLATKGQMHIGQTGLFKEKYLEWKRRNIANKTWNDFKTFWNSEFADYKTINKITAKLNRLGAYATVEDQTNVYDTLKEAMDNLAFATTTSNSAFEQLTASNAKLAEQLAKAMNLLKKAQEDNSKFLKIIKASVAGTKPQGGGRKGKRRIDFEKTDHLMDPTGNQATNWVLRELTPWVAVASITGGNPNGDTNQ